MTTTPLMSLVLPVDQGSTGVWDVLLDTIFGLVDGHDHTTGKGSKVPVAGINVNADLSFSPTGTPRALTDVKAIDFAAVASSAVASLAGAFFLSDGTGGLVANELYFRTTGGSNVRIMNGAALNVAAFAGGIGGDYAAISALLDYDDATDTYRFRQETAASVRQFAKVQFADIKLIEYDPSGDASVPAAALTIRSPDSLAGAYNLTMFTALPGSTSLVQLDSAGQFTASNTVANAVTLSAVLTANGGVTAGANQNVTVSGTGEYKHGDRILSLHAGNGTGASVSYSQSTDYGATVASPGSVAYAIPLRSGDRIKSVSFTLSGDGVADAAITVRTWVAGTKTTIGTGSAVNPPNLPTVTTVTIDVTDTTVTSTMTVYADVVVSGGGTTITMFQILATYDRP